MNLKISHATSEDRVQLDLIRGEAFQPVFESFRNILGDEIYDLAQRREDEKQGELLASMLDGGSEWEVFSVECSGEIVGFTSVKLDMATSVGEIGLNAVAPSHSNKGIGTKMYDFCVKYMEERGMKVATVSTGGDPSHAPARRAYEKAGFDVQISGVWMCQLL